jgi:hypothetical protein
MTPYTIALAGKAYLTKAACFGKIQQTTGKRFTSTNSAISIASGNDGSAVLRVVITFFRSLPYPYSVANQPLLKRKEKQGSTGSFPGIRANLKSVKVLLQIATNGLKALTSELHKLYLDTGYLTTSFDDVIVSKSFLGRGNYKLMPVRSAQ